MDRFYAGLAQCDAFRSIGSSGHVYPLTGFIQLAANVSAHAVELNLDRF